MNRLSHTVKRLSESPCTRCKNGETCENKHCPKWRAWYLKEWKKFNNYYNKYKNNQETQEESSLLFNRRNRNE